MSTNPNLPTPDECFISVLLDEWLKNSHCLDSKKEWDADPKRPFPFNEIVDFLVKQGASDGDDLGLLMVQEAINRISQIGRSVDICPCCLVQVVGQVSLKKGERVLFAKERLVSEGLCEHEAETFLRCVSLFLNVLRGDWPYEYVGQSRASDDEAIDSEGGQQ
jgi:hypothetical protein